MAGDDDGFLSRWSRRKLQREEAAAAPVAPAAQAPLAASATVAAAAAPAAPQAVQPAASAPDAPVAPAPPPTLEDVAALDVRSADLARFVARDVDPTVRNAALKKLFAEPQWNVMDGLDVYIDDYGKPDPLPAAALRRMAQSQFLGLFREEERPPAALADNPPPTLPETAPEPDENADLRLQPDDAAGADGAGAGAGEDAGREP
jgi:hypothetical protein